MNTKNKFLSRGALIVVLFATVVVLAGNAKGISIYDASDVVKNLNINGTQIQSQYNADGTKSGSVVLPGGSIELQRSPTGGMVQIQGPGGSQILINRSAGGLNVQTSSGLINEQAKSAIVNLSGNSDVLIQNNQDFETYGNLVIEARPAVRNVSFSGNQVVVGYKQPAKFIGLVGVNLTGTVYVDGAGKVEIKLPWYSFLFTKNTNEVEKNIEINIQQAQASNEIRASANNSATGSGSSLTVQDAAHVVNIVTTQVNNNANLSVQSGDKSVNIQTR